MDELVVRHRDELQTPVRQNATGPSSSGSGGGGDLDGARGPGAVAPGAVAAEGEELREAAGRVLAVVHRFLFEGPGRFTMPDYGRSNVPPKCVDLGLNAATCTRVVHGMIGLTLLPAEFCFGAP